MKTNRLAIAAALIGLVVGFGSARLYDPQRDAAVAEAEQLRGELNHFANSLKTTIEETKAKSRDIDAQIRAAAAKLPTQ